MAFHLITPSRVETALTGFVGAVEKTLRGKLYRAAFHAGESSGRFTRNGVDVAWDRLPHAAKVAFRDGYQILAKTA